MKAPAATGRMKISLWTMLRQIRAWNVHGVLRTLEQKHAVRAGATLVIILTSWSLFLLSVAGILDLQLLVQHEFFLMIRYGYVAALWLLILGTVMVLVVEWRGIMSLLRIDQIDLGSLEQRHPYLPTKPFVILSFVLTLSAPVLFYAVTQQTSAAFAVVEEPYVYAEARSWQIANDMISNGANAIDVIGQYVDETASPLVPAYTKGGVNNTVNKLGFWAPWSIALDGTNHRLFVADYTDNRILIYNLNTDNSFPDRIPDYVLGQSNFSTSTNSATQAGLNRPSGLAYDTTNNRLFVAEYNSNRITVFDVSSITNGMNAANVLGPSTFVGGGSLTTQAGMKSPSGLAYDSTSSRLFVAEYTNNRVIVFNVSSITNGMNAINVLGQSTFTTSAITTTQAGIYSPYGLLYDATNNRLFVTESSNNRVSVFNVSSITNGMNATNVLGQGTFTALGSATTQAGMDHPFGLAYDATNSRLFVSEYSNNRISVFNISSITDGMNAANILGQSSYTTRTAATTQAGLNSPYGLAFDTTNNHLFVVEGGNNRIAIFDTSSITDGQNAIDALGQYEDETASPLVPAYTKSGANNSPNRVGLYVPYGIALDGSNHRLFVAENSNSRVLVYNLNTDNTFPDYIPDYVLGQSNFTNRSQGPTQAGMYNPHDLAYDAVNNRLFVTDNTNNRVLVFDTSSISNGMNATNVLGQSTFTGGSNTTTQNGMYSPRGLAYDAVNNRLFVSEYYNNRVTVFDTTSIINGMNAINVLGQSSFTTSYSATTQMGMSWPWELTVDAVNNRLFVADYYNNRVTVFDTTSIINGMNAINVLGQSSFTTATAATTQAGMIYPAGLTFDAVNNRLFVADGNNRITVFDASSITNGMNASAVLGQSSFTAGGAATTQAGLYGPNGLAYDPANGRLYVADTSNNRIMVFDAAMQGTTVTLTSSQTPVTYGTNFTLTAGFTPSTVNGSVTIKEGETVIGTAAVSRGSGSLTLSTLSVGTHSLTAVYAGSGGYKAATSAAINQVISMGTPTVSLTGPSPVPAGMTSLSAIISPASATGTVTFTEGVTTLGTAPVIGGIASIGLPNLAMGSHTVSASYGGNANLNSASSNSFTLTVGKGNSTTTLLTTPDPSDGTGSVTLTASVTPTTANGTVTFLDGASSIGSTTLGANGTGSIVISNFTTGIHTLTAVYGGNSTLSGSTSLPRTQTVRAATTAIISMGAAAREVIGQYEDETVSPMAPVYTKGGANNSLGKIGMNSPWGVTIDGTHLKFYIADTFNNRVLVYSLNSDHSFTHQYPDYVIGQSNFTSNISAVTQAGLRYPYSLAVDEARNRLFVADYTNNRVLVYNTLAISNGMNAMNVIGQTSFTSSTAATTQGGLNGPFGMVSDSTSSRLFVSSYYSNRVTVYNTTTISNGMNASNVLGQPNFTTSTAAWSQSQMRGPTGIALDVSGGRLFVAEDSNHRVLVFNISAITDGMNASNVLGQSSFTVTNSLTTQSGICAPQGVAFDPIGNRLFVGEYSNNRVIVFDTSSISNGMNASSVLGQSTFTANGVLTGQAGLQGPIGLAYDPVSSRLFVADKGNNRVLVFDTSSITNGQNAIDVLGQFQDETASPLVPVYTKGTANNGPNRVGIAGMSDAEIDVTNHRLFVVDGSNNRVLVYALNGDNTFSDRIPDYVLGQNNFAINDAATTQAGMRYPAFLTYDATHFRLFVSDSINNRVLVFNISSIANGMNAAYVLGQSSFTNTTTATTQTGMFNPRGLAYDDANDQLYAAEQENNRITIFNTADISNGMNATYVLGQSSFTTNTATVTQSGLKGSWDIALDTAHNRLFVSQINNTNRVTVFNVSSITNGMNAAYVLGQSTFTTSTPSTTQAGMNGAYGLAYDVINDRLFVADNFNHRVTVFNVSSITNGMNAACVLGQSSFTTSTTATTQTGVNGPEGLAYDATNNRLFVGEIGNHRIMVFDAAVIATTTTLTPSANPAHFGDLTLTATVSPSNSTGNVTFREGATVLGTSTVTAGVATLNANMLTMGAHSITATYNGDATRGPSTSAVLAQNVDYGSSTTVLTSSQNPSGAHVSLTLTVSVTPSTATGTVTFYEAGTLLATSTVGHGSGSTIIADPLVGSHTYVAGFSGNQNCSGSTGSLLQNVATRMMGNGMYASDLLGQVTNPESPTTPVYTKGGANDTPNTIGMSTPYAVAIDSPGHRLFVADAGNHRVLVYLLNSDNTLAHRYADNVLGQPDFGSVTAGNTQATMNSPRGLAYDSTNSRLFVSEYPVNRVKVFNVSSITNGMNATNVLGQTSFTGTSSANTQLGMYAPYGLAFDAINNRLFVAEYSGNRVKVFNTSSITDGMNASNILGMSIFTSAGNPSTISQITTIGPTGLAYSPTNSRLFVAQAGPTIGRPNRVTVFNVSSITNGMSAISVIGQSSFTTYNAAITQPGLAYPNGLAYDSTNSRLFVSQGYGTSYNRVTVYSVVSITNGQNAANVLGQGIFTGTSYATTQNGMYAPYGMAYDSTNSRLYIPEGSNNRITVQNVSSITNGQNAMDALGQVRDSGESPLVPVYTQTTLQSAVRGRVGFSSPIDAALDSIHHRLYVVDNGNKRVLVYNLNADNSFIHRSADNVLGQPNFYTSSALVSQAGISNPYGVAIDSAGNRLFVADNTNSRILVFDTSTITDGMNAMNVLGQSNFTASASVTTQAGMSGPYKITYDAVGRRLFVGDIPSNRILIFDGSSISDGMNAMNVLGQSDFTSNAIATTQAGMNSPRSLSFDTAGNRLFVGDMTNNRVLVFDSSSITNGMNAANVLGQSDFTSGTSGLTRSTFSSPQGVTFNTNNNQLIVADANNNRVMIFDTSNVTDGMDASSVLGQSTFTTNTAATTQGGLSAPNGLLYDASTGRLFVTQIGNHRISIFDTSSTYSATALTSSLNPSGIGASVTFTANVTPATATGNVIFMNSGVTFGTGTLVGGTTSVSTSGLPIGSNSITAQYLSPTSVLDNSTSIALVQYVRALTTTSVTADTNPSTYGNYVTFTASVSPSDATGTFTFKDGTRTIGTATIGHGSGSIAVIGMGAGAHSITARYSGDTTYVTSTSDALTETVEQAPSSITVLQSSLNPSTFGSGVTLRATLVPSAATGSVTFFDGARSLGSILLSNGSGSITIATLGAGSHALTAVYQGNGSCVGSTSSILTQTVTQAPSSRTTLTSLRNLSFFGDGTTVTATLTPIVATGSVTFYDGAQSLGSVLLSHGSGSVSINTMGVGSHSLSAIYAGNGSCPGSTSNMVSQTITQASTITTLITSPDPSDVGGSVTLTASIFPISATGSITFADSGATIGSADLINGSATITISNFTAYNHPLTASYSGNANAAGSTSYIRSQWVRPAAGRAMTDGESAWDMIGQVEDISQSPLVPAFTKNATNGGVGRVGFSSPYASAIDSIHHRLFIAEAGNNRVLVYQLNPDHSFRHRYADYVLGQSNFLSYGTARTQARMNSPIGLSVDSIGNRLFVADRLNHRILVFDTSTMINGMNATNVLGQSNFTEANTATTQATMNTPNGIAIDTTQNRLFVAESGANRVTVYNVTSISDGMNAMNVLGQSNFTAAGAATTQARMNTPYGIAIDTTQNRLFVAEYVANRVTVYNVTSISDGMNATNVLGQTSFTAGLVTNTQAGLSGPFDLAIDMLHHRLFVTEYTKHLVAVFDTTSIVNGMNAVDALGQVEDITVDPLVPVYTTSTQNATPNKVGMSSPYEVILDTVNHRLFVADINNHRVLIYNLNADNTFAHRFADNVLGQSNFLSNGSATTQMGMFNPGGIAFDPRNNRLFVSQISNHRISIFDISSITNGMNAVNVLGQPNFLSSTAGTTQATMNYPYGLALDTTKNRLFVAQSNINRITVYDITSITDGMNAVNVLGQPSFTAASAATTQAGMNSPRRMALDLPNNKLFVTEYGNNRVLVFDTSSITDGMNAVDVLGQYDDSLTDPQPVFTKGGVNNGPNRFGIGGYAYDIAIDVIHHRLFVADGSNNRVLCYTLHSDNTLEDYRADYVLGQSDFVTSTSAITQSGIHSPLGLAYDESIDRLYVAGGNRVTIYDVASISNGMNAMNVLGQQDFTTNTASTTQAVMNGPSRIALDIAHNRLFVPETNNNRVTVFSTAAITNGMNAVNVLGQSTFTTSASAITQAGMSAPIGVAYDAAVNRLFVSEWSNNRVTVYDVASITDGKNSMNVLGQNSFTVRTSATTQSGMYAPNDVAYDSARSLLFVTEGSNYRVTVYNVASITNGQNAMNVLGQPNFTSSVGVTAQAAFSQPIGLEFDPLHNRLYVGQLARILMFNVSSITDGMNAIDALGQYDDSVTDPQPVFTKNAANNGPNKFGFYGPVGISLDGTNHRLFVADSANHRVLVFGLNVDGTFTSRIPTNVLGKPNYYSGASSTTQSSITTPYGLALDEANARLFIAEASSNRISVFDVTPGSYVPPTTSTLTGYVFRDTNLNGTKDAGETTGFNTILLTLTGNTGTGGTLRMTTRTAANGAYSFSAVPTGGPYLLVSGMPLGYMASTTASRTVTFTAGGQTSTQNIGLKPKPPPVVSQVAVITTGSAATIVWKTDQEASSKVQFAPLAATKVATPEVNTGTGVTTHSIDLSSLPRCVSYRYQVISNDPLAQQATSAEQSFQTAGCPGSATIMTASGAVVSPAMRQEIGIRGTGTGMRLLVPAGGVTRSLTFQVAALEAAPVLSALTMPSGKTPVQRFFALSALSGSTTEVTTFEKPLTVTMEYSREDVAGMDETTLAIWRNDDGVWTALSDCSVDTSGKTVECTTEHFSTFGLFGTQTVSGGSEGGSVAAGVETAPVVAMAGSRRPREEIVPPDANAGAGQPEEAHAAAGTVTVDIVVPGVPVPGRLTPEERAALQAERARVEAATIQEQSGRIRADMARRRAERVQRIVHNTEAMTTGQSSFGAWLQNAAAAAMDDAGIAWEGMQEVMTGLRETVAGGWNRLVAAGASLYRSTVARLDIRGEMAAIRQALEQSPARHQTGIRNDNGRLVLASLQIALVDDDGNPYSHAPVVLYSDPQVTETDAYGIAVFHDVELREHRLEIHTREGQVRERSIRLTSTTLPSSLQDKTVTVTIPVIQIVVGDDEQGFTMRALLFIAAWSTGILALGVAGGMRWRRRKVERRG